MRRLLEETKPRKRAYPKVGPWNSQFLLGGSLALCRWFHLRLRGLLRLFLRGEFLFHLEGDSVGVHPVGLGCGAERLPPSGCVRAASRMTVSINQPAERAFVGLAEKAVSSLPADSPSFALMPGFGRPSPVAFRPAMEATARQQREGRASSTEPERRQQWIEVCECRLRWQALPRGGASPARP